MPLGPGIGVPRDHSDLHILDGVRQNGEVNNGCEEHVFGAFRDSRPDSWHLHQPSRHHQDLLMNRAPWNWCTERVDEGRAMRVGNEKGRRSREKRKSEGMEESFVTRKGGNVIQFSRLI